MGYDRYGWQPYVPVAQRRAKAEKALSKLAKKGLQVQPVTIDGRKIAASFWGKGWCDHIESFGDYANRLPRGRTYVRNGSVCHLDIQAGKIEAIVSGTSLYNVTITISQLSSATWKEIKASCSGRISSLIDLLRGKLADGVMEVVSDRKKGLFPLPGEMKFTCSCPDWAGMCKHVAAVLYGVGSRLDHAPEKLFLLRGVNHEELVDLTATLQEATTSKSSRRRIAGSGLADVFGVDLADADAPPLPVRRPGKAAVPAVSTPVAGKETDKQPAKSPRLKKTVAVPAKLPEPVTGEAILAWRTRLHETQAIFAKRLSVTSASISQWEKKGPQTINLQTATLASLRKAWKAAHGVKVAD